MGRIFREDKGKKKMVTVTHDHQRPPKSPDPFAEYIASMSYKQALQKDMMSKQQNQNRNQNPNSGRSTPNTNIGSANGGTGAPSVDTPLSSSSSSIQLQFGKIKYDPSLLNTSHVKFLSNNAKTSSSSSPSSEPHISNSDIPKLQRLIKLAIDAGRLRGKCAKCGNSVQHCCEQTILKAVSSLPSYTS